MIFKKGRLFILLGVVFCICAIIKVGIWDNPGILCKIAEGFDDPSASFYFAIERIYKISQKKNFDNKITQYLENGKNSYLYDIYLRILGVVGSKESLYHIKNIYVKYQNDTNYKGTLFYVIRSIGLIGDTEIVPFLETLLNKYKDLNVQVSESNIVSALYLITGDAKYYFTNSSGERQKLYLTSELIEARKVIEKSRNRDRTFEEMLILDRLYRPVKKRL
jgi:hypothetical protein